MDDTTALMIRYCMRLHCLGERNGPALEGYDVLGYNVVFLQTQSLAQSSNTANRTRTLGGLFNLQLYKLYSSSINAICKQRQSKNSILCCEKGESVDAWSRPCRSVAAVAIGVYGRVAWIYRIVFVHFGLAFIFLFRSTTHLQLGANFIGGSRLLVFSSAHSLNLSVVCLPIRHTRILPDTRGALRPFDYSFTLIDTGRLIDPSTPLADPFLKLFGTQPIASSSSRIDTRSSSPMDRPAIFHSRRILLVHHGELKPVLLADDLHGRHWICHLHTGPTY